MFLTPVSIDFISILCYVNVKSNTFSEDKSSKIVAYAGCQSSTLETRNTTFGEMFRILQHGLLCCWYFFHKM